MRTAGATPKSTKSATESSSAPKREVDFRNRAGDGANFLGEASFKFQEGRRVLMDTFGRIDDVAHGRKLPVLQPNNGGRTLGAFYFVKGLLIMPQVTVTPANGDYETPDTARFIDSLAFEIARTAEVSKPLPVPR